MSSYKVYLGSCERYQTEKIDQVLKTALNELCFSHTFYGKVVIKPNLVLAHPKIAQDGFTRVEVIESILRLVLSRKDKDTATSK